ncbi:hypothetical protein GMOD_00004962 [Pyrenophora seminiperda CCB06]|uniref:Uncharacterized protein n=1 Tax=Pyrenophora seminiperda CCB06 TaxID=1302712 RepID=A0A3M7MI38_9PLEO|nr:hypothetical protein GMOD_00004962 [Pyrenophora seminiperda CCB06]
MSLRINAETLCELFRAVQSLQTIFTSIQPLISGLQPLMNNIQQFSSDSIPNFVDDNDCIQSESEDDGTVEPGAEDDSSYHSTDRSASTMLCCPHPTCANKPRTYTQNSSLVRHFGEHINIEIGDAKKS